MPVSFGKIDGLQVISPVLYSDERGEVLESYGNELKSKIDAKNLEQTLISTSSLGVLRGFHYQIKCPLTQAIQCIEGEVLDFAIDLRKKSKTYKKIFQIKISGSEKKIIYLPPGVAHGFLSLSSNSILLYYVSGLYSKVHERGINYKSLNLKLPFEPKIVNERDSNWPSLNDAEHFEDF